MALTFRFSSKIMYISSTILCILYFQCLIHLVIMFVVKSVLFFSVWDIAHLVIYFLIIFFFSFFLFAHKVSSVLLNNESKRIRPRLYTKLLFLSSNEMETNLFLLYYLCRVFTFIEWFLVYLAIFLDISQNIHSYIHEHD